MVRYWKTVGLTVSLGMFLVARPALRAAEPTSDTGATSTAQLRQIQERLGRIEQKLDANLNVIRQNQLATDIKADDASREVLALKHELAEARRALDELRNRSNTISSTSAYGPGGAVPASTGTVRLVNTSPAEEVVTVNGLAYHLAPGETRAVAVPAGTFNYQVLGTQPGPQPRAVAPNQAFTVTLFPLGM